MKQCVFHIFLLALFNSIHLNASSEPTSLIVIRGAANSGKSTLCKTLNNMLNNSYVIVSQDDLHRKVSYKALTGMFPRDMELINHAIAYQNRWQAIQYGNVIFSKEKEIDIHKEELVMKAINKISSFFDDPDNNKQLKALRALGKQKTMHQLTLYAAQGKNVIFDAWGVTNWDNELDELKKYFSYSIGVVAYCSLQTVKLRWENRNSCAIKTGDYTDMRIMKQMLRSFFGFLQPKESAVAQDCLTVTKREFDEVMQKALPYAHDHQSKHAESFSGREFSVEELLDFKNKMYAKFHFNENEEVAIVPSVPYDILLCTEGDCHDYAAELLRKITLFLYAGQK